MLIVPQLARGLGSKNLSKNNMYHELRPETLYLFFACNNKKFFLAKVREFFSRCHMIFIIDLKVHLF